MNAYVEQAIEKFETTIVNETEFEEAYNEIKYVFQQTGSNDPSGLFLLGDAGVGKTTVIDTFLKDHPPIELEDRTLMPVVQINAASTPSIHDFAEKLLAELDSTGIVPKRLETKKRCIQALKEQLQLKMVIIDEFHDMLPNTSNTASSDVVKFVKYLLSQLKVSVIVVGLSQSKYVLCHDKQIETRCNSTITLHPFSAHDDVNAQRFFAYMNALLETYPHKVNVLKEEGMLRLLLATNGNNRNIKRLLIRAANETQPDQETTLDVLHSSWEKTINDKGTTLPFMSPIKAVKTELVKKGLL